MSTAIKTAAAIDAAIVANAEKPHRAHLGASVIGRPCERQLWYSFRWTLAEKHEPRMLRLFERGQLEEKRFVGYLRAAGVEIWEVNPETGKQWRIEDHEGHFGGSLDGVGRGIPDLPPDEAFVTEYKTHGDKSFEKLKAEGLLKAKWEHYVQTQVYMGKMSLRYALYIGVNKNTDELYFELVPFVQAEFDRAINRAKGIIWDAVPPARISDSPGYFACKYCHLNRLCHFGGVTPDRNCRTCVFGEPSGGGLWRCKHADVRSTPNKGFLDEAAQRAACPQYSARVELTTRQP